MRNRKKLNRRLLLPGVFTLILSVLLGCSTVGPSSLSRGRVAYNEVLTETNAEQCLASIVKARYGQISTILAVSSINASIRFRASGGVNIGVGNAASYAQNLVPLSVGAAYEENPTITYLPVQGEEHIKGLLAPVSLDVLISLVNSAAFDPSVAFILLVTRINRIPNRAFVSVSLQSCQLPRIFYMMLAFCGAVQAITRKILTLLNISTKKQPFPQNQKGSPQNITSVKKPKNIHPELELLINEKRLATFLIYS